MNTGTSLVGLAISQATDRQTVGVPPNTKHWHGAAADSSMSHIAIQDAFDGKSADWMDPVNEQEYLTSTGSAAASQGSKA